MTSTLTPGDIVLRGGRAEVVGEVYAQSYRPTDWHEQPGFRAEKSYPLQADATPLGINTRDGWKPHNGSERPEGVGAEDLIEYVTWHANRVNGPMQLSSDGIAWDGTIRAYRIVRRADPPAPDRDAEVRAVAAELREKARVVVSTAQMHTWADRLDPKPAPELKVGNRVFWLRPGSYARVEANILAIVGDRALLTVTGQHRPDAALLSELERIP